MSIEEIFHAYEFNLRHGFINNTDKYREPIIAALRAGQALYEELETRIWAESSDGRVDSKDKTPAMQAWDATTKGDEG